MDQFLLLGDIMCLCHLKIGTRGPTSDKLIVMFVIKIILSVLEFIDVWIPPFNFCSNAGITHD